MSKIVVVGANHAGTYAINTILSSLGEDKEKHQVVVYDRNDNISFLGCGMALWIGNVIDSGDELFYATPESLRENGANVYMEHEMIDVDFEKKEITVKDTVSNKLITDTYDKLILGIGSWPILPKLEGYDLENIMYAKIYQNAVECIDKLKDETIKNVVVVGAGYIGVELAEAFIANGKNVTLINDTEILNKYYDEDIQKMMHNRLVENGVNVVTGELVEKFIGNDQNKVSKVVTTSNTYDADLVLMSIGFKPRTEMLQEKEIELSSSGAIKTNKKMETSVKDVYAIGDCTNVYNNALGRYQNIALASNAVRTGITAGLNAIGSDIEMQGVQGSNSIHIFGLTLCSTGLTEGEAIKAGFEVDSITLTDNIRPEFMPNNEKVTIKIVWSTKSRRILGAQIASNEDITLAIHFFSLAIQESYTIDKLAFTDLFFLPHFNKPENFITKAGLMALLK